MKLQKNPVNQMPIKNYLFISWTYITAMYLSNLSFQFVSYPTQVLTKSCKPITGYYFLKIVNLSLNFIYSII